MASNSSVGSLLVIEITPAVAFLPKNSDCGPFSTSIRDTSNMDSLMVRPWP